MKKSLFLIAATAAASLAAPVHFGIDAKVGYNILSLGSDLDAGIVTGSPKSQPSFGVAVGPSIAFDLNEQFALGGGAYFLYDMNRYNTSSDSGLLGSYKNEHTINQMSLGLQFAPIFRINEFFSVKVGYEWDMPFGGTSETKSTATILGQDLPSSTDKHDITWAPKKGSDAGSKAPILSTHNVIVGGAYQVTPNFALTLQGKIGLTGILPDYNVDLTSSNGLGDLKGAAGSKSNMMVHQIALGINLGM